MTRTIVITGATGDIAQELITRLQNDHLILLSRNLSVLTEKYGHLKNVTLMENAALEKNPPMKVDILINNAGFGVFKKLSALTESEIKQQFAVNTLFAIQCVRYFNPQVQLITIASIAGKIPSSKSTIYAASKAAIISFSDALRMERQELLVTTVNTGPVLTKFHQNHSEYLKKVGKNSVSAAFVAEKIIHILGKNKPELNLPWQMAVVAKCRALAPILTDRMARKFFDFK